MLRIYTTYCYLLYDYHSNLLKRKFQHDYFAILLTLQFQEWFKINWSTRPDIILLLCVRLSSGGKIHLI